MAEIMETGFLAVQEKDASSEIRDSLLTFGEDVLQTKFPSYMDGLKDVTRRIIWCAREYRDAKGLGKIIGDIGDIHVSGDSSIYGAVVRLAQSFMVGHPIITIEGKSGKYYDPGAAAAPRYLKAYLSEFSRDIFFNGVNLKTIPMVPTKDFGSMEPRHFIPRLPTALIMGNLTVGFGFKSFIPMIDFEDVCNLVMAFSEFYQKGGIGIPNHRLIARYVVPTFPIQNLIKNREELIQHYNNGNYTKAVSIEGWAEVSGNTIVLRTVPYGTDFGTVTKTIRDLMKDRKHWLWDHLVTINQYSSDVAELSIEVKRGQNPFEVFDLIRSTLRFSTMWHPIYSYMKDGRALSLNPATLTYLWYQERMISIAGGLKYKQADLIYKKMTLEAMLIICEHSDEVINIIKNSEDEEDATNALYKRFEKLTWKQAKIVAGQRVSILAKSNKRQIESDLEQLDIDLQNTVASFSRIHETIHSDAQFLKKKYRSTRESKFSDEFIGYVQFGNLGIIHFFNEEEMYSILNSKGWPNHVKKSIHLYDPKTPLRCMMKNGKLIPMIELSKEIACEGIVCYPLDKSELTLVIGKDQNTCIVERSVTGVYGDFTLCPISKTFYALHRNGAVTEENSSSFSIRKTISKGAKTDLIYGLQNKVSDLVVFHMNTSDINTLRVDRIIRADGLGSLKTVPTGNMQILGIYPIRTKEIYLNIPDDCKKNVAMDHLVIRNISAMFGDNKNHHTINLGKTTGFNKRFKRNPSVRTLFTLDLSEKE